MPAAVAHRPSIAAADGDSGPRRSLILAGGGMRVAWQAGVLRALHEHGLRFAHGDGTSGGIMNLAMLLSGVTPEDMCRRWQSLPVADFVSFLPWRDYVRSPHLPALGSPDGVAQRVFPHLGIDISRIHGAQGMAGTFNVCDYTRKVNVSLPHTDVDRDLLVAGISLPIFMPPLRRDGTIYMDSVWIRDANPLEGVRRGADELWVVWCIGNIAEYHDGMFNQYVHMIEIAAAGRLNEDLEALAAVNAQRAAAGRTPIRLHVVTPRYALPLDPVYYSGGITGEELVAMGYRDAAAYLDGMSPDGVAPAPEVTRMEVQPPGRRVVEEMALEQGRLRLVVEVNAPGHGSIPAGRICGSVSLTDLGDGVPLRGGTLSVVDGGSLHYAAALRAGGEDWTIEVLRPVRTAADGTQMTLRRGHDAGGEVVATSVVSEASHTVDAVLRTLGLADPHPVGDLLRDVLDRLRALVGRKP